MATARNLCQHSDIDGTQCTSNDYISCPHCQLQLCLKHLNYHQELLRSDLLDLTDQIDEVHCNLNNLIFDSTNYRQELFEQLDQWYRERIDYVNRLYSEKKQELHMLCTQAYTEFEMYKDKKNKQLKENLLKQLQKVLKQKQVNIDDFNEMKMKLNDIERGLNELKYLLIDVYPDNTMMNIHFVKRRYIEAAKPSFDIDDDDNQWDTDDDDGTNEKIKSSEDIQIIEQMSTPPDIIILPSLKTTPSLSCSSTTIIKKEPLKFIIKRLQQPTASTKVKYKLHTVATSPSVLRT
ncbi:unnamed protein product [Adineta ricciae]|uniref:Uncharacterized protein n=1 Tax=Adineta ricciae TaxID=249248 RepID=A0A814AIY8_ADIRI|nr:unnamed protein product [Adineta ricciae]CAF1449173.1 unnamed protein product [Adineta ricciae]